MIDHQVILKLNPSVVTIRGDVAYDADDNIVEYDRDAVEAYAKSKEYITKRVNEYPSIGDQLDALFHAGVFPEEMAEKIQAIKNKYPKS
jgi:phytoene dehydrogenase-like protein